MDILSSIRNVSIAVAITLFTVGTAYAGSVESTACQIGKYTGNSLVLMDANENAAWNGPATDILHGLAQAFPRGDAVVGDWNGDGADDMGKYNSSNNAIFLDLNGNKSWDQPAGGDLQSTFAGFAGPGIVISGDWNMDGADEIGLYVPGNDFFFLDLNGDGVYNGADDVVALVGPTRTAGIPIVGDWNGDGRDSVGKVIDASSTYYLDVDGNFVWNPPTDRQSVFANFATPYTPVAGNFSNATAGDEIGKYVPGSGTNDLFLLDTNDDGVYTNGVDTLAGIAQVFGSGDPIICDFNDDGIDDIGKAVSSVTSANCGSGQCYFLDANGNGVWDGFGTDIGSTFAAFTDPSDTMSEAISGHWLGGAGGGGSGAGN